jgi:hypothetical protein
MGECEILFLHPYSVQCYTPLSYTPLGNQISAIGVALTTILVEVQVCARVTSSAEGDGQQVLVAPTRALRARLTPVGRLQREFRPGVLLLHLTGFLRRLCLHLSRLP